MGGLYKVFFAPDGGKYYSLSQAKANGFPSDGHEDGRKTKAKGKTKSKTRPVIKKGKTASEA